MTGINNMVGDYIWQDEPFRLYINDDNTGLTGMTHFGDNIEDEWFIVHLLLTLSSSYDDVAISLTDEAGQFLLIQTAHLIPRWLSPSNSDNRVWLYQGKVHIIPKPTTPNEIFILPTGPDLTVSAALKVLSDPEYDGIYTEATEAVNDSILVRINETVNNRDANQVQYAQCYLPANIAYLLKNDAQLVAPAVTSFYYRDALQMRACNRMKKFEIDPDTMIFTMVRFTRCLYAQLSKQEIRPPPPFKDILSNSNDPLYMAKYLGMKLTCGFEILYKEGFKNRHNKNKKEWAVVIETILEEAKDIFVGGRSSTKNGINIFGNEDNYFKLGKLFDDTPTDWMIISPEEVDKILYEKQKEFDSYYESVFDEENPNQDKINPDNLFDNLVNDMNHFVSSVSDYEGVDLDDTQSRDFDYHKFMDIMQNHLNLNDPEQESSDEGDEFYTMGSEEEDLKDIMGAMDEELHDNTNIHEGFEKTDGSQTDINLNLVKNLLESYASQEGMAGPVGNILSDLRLSE
eukprot:TRINITY_DN6955_c0_g1_i1.p1 TRINITY_DN6955_c0_g1~~TRINITY_DN6955_c0_g1_i1.p1  ORF type:complete len:559 (-),score=127.41 TRINITY_DN6955_c0_g1_i1:38-1579(-)